jgi:hypothetical protein
VIHCQEWFGGIAFLAFTLCLVYSSRADFQGATHLMPFDILSGKDTRPEFQKLGSDTKRAILEILGETKEGLPKYWSL